MILVTHAVAGAALGSISPNWEVAFLLGFVSHFILDAIPHWDYDLTSRQQNGSSPLDDRIAFGRAFLFDLVKLGIDFGLGLILVFTFLRSSNSAPALLWFGLLGGVFPDLLQFTYFKLRWPVLARTQRFHHWVHARRRLAGRSTILGVTSQVVLVVLILGLF